MTDHSSCFVLTAAADDDAVTGGSTQSPWHIAVWILATMMPAHRPKQRDLGRAEILLHVPHCTSTLLYGTDPSALAFAILACLPPKLPQGTLVHLLWVRVVRLAPRSRGDTGTRTLRRNEQSHKVPGFSPLHSKPSLKIGNHQSDLSYILRLHVH